MTRAHLHPHPHFQRTHFEHIGLIARSQSAATKDIKVDINQQIISLYQALTDMGKSVTFDQQTAKNIKHNLNKRNTAPDLAALAKQTDLGIVFGGDGRLLETAPYFAEAGTPLLGINYGRLGFLADISSESLKQVLDLINAGHFVPEERLLIQVKVQRENELLAAGIALNDIVLHAAISKMIEFELYINELFVYSQRSDGIILATPTGSTAYALSAGGPIIQPDLDTLVLVPNSAHTLTSRPIVVSANSAIKIRLGQPPYPILSCDGQTKITTQQNDVILISKHPYKLKLIHPTNYDFYSTCREKLGWGQKLGKTHASIFSA